MKKSLLFIGLLAVILTSCHKEAIVNFSYTVSKEYDYYYDTPYVLLSTYNLSLNAESYKWELECPGGDFVTSYSDSPSFKCYTSGYYVLKLTAYSKNGDWKSEAKNIFINVDSDDPQNPVDPSSFTITWLRLENIPMQDGNNASWDTGLFGGGDPDIYFKILDANNHVLYTSSSVEDVSSSDLPHTWTGINTTLNYNANQYSIHFYDKDGDLDSDDHMAGCIITPSDMTPSSSSFVWYNGDIGVRFTFGTTWSY